MNSTLYGVGAGTQFYCAAIQSADAGGHYECDFPMCTGVASPGSYSDMLGTLSCVRTPVDTTGDGTPDCPGMSGSLTDFATVDAYLTTAIGWGSQGPVTFDQCLSLIHISEPTRQAENS